MKGRHTNALFIYKLEEQRYMMLISQDYHKNSTSKKLKVKREKEELTSIIHCHSQYDIALLGWSKKNYFHVTH